MNCKHYENFCAWLKATGQRNCYNHSLKTFILFCQDQKIEYKDITFDYMNKFLILLKEKNLSEGSINNFLKAVRSFYGFLITSKVVTKEVLEEVRTAKYLKVPEKDRVFYKIEEIDEIVEMGSCFIRTISAIKLKAILYFMFYSGVRKGELSRLKREDIDLEECYALIRTPNKTQRERKVPFTKEVKKILSDYFTTEIEKESAFNMSYFKIHRLFEGLKEFAPKNKPFSAHILRTSFFYFLAKKGFNLRQMQKLGGHKSIESTQKYYNPSVEEALGAYKEILEKKPKKK